MKITLSVYEFTRALGSVLHAVSDDLTRGTLWCVLLRVIGEGRNFVTVGTNGHWLAAYTGCVCENDGCRAGTESLIPLESAKAMLRLLKTFKPDLQCVDIDFETRTLSVPGSTLSWVSPTEDGAPAPFPPYLQIVPAYTRETAPERGLPAIGFAVEYFAGIAAACKAAAYKNDSAQSRGLVMRIGNDPLDPATFTCGALLIVLMPMRLEDDAEAECKAHKAHRTALKGAKTRAEKVFALAEKRQEAARTAAEVSNTNARH